MCQKYEDKEKGILAREEERRKIVCLLVSNSSIKYSFMKEQKAGVTIKLSGFSPRSPLVL